MTLAQAYYLSERYDDAMLLLKKAVAEQPDYLGNYIIQAAVYAQVGLMEEAQQSASKVLELAPFFKTESFGTVFRNPEDRNKLIEGLRMAGLE